MSARSASDASNRVVERRRAVILARPFREAEGLSNAQIADRLGRSPATVKAYFYDPTGEKAQAVKTRYVGLSRSCGAFTQPRNGNMQRYCERYRPWRSCRTGLASCSRHDAKGRSVTSATLNGASPHHKSRTHACQRRHW
jgi:AraC-like DNA-binding protein